MRTDYLVIRRQPLKLSEELFQENHSPLSSVDKHFVPTNHAQIAKKTRIQ